MRKVKCDRKQGTCWVEKSHSGGKILHGRGGLVPQTLDFSIPVSLLKSSRVKRSQTGGGVKKKRKKKKKNYVDNLLKGFGKKKRKRKKKLKIAA
jgi:hypothetical protein